MTEIHIPNFDEDDDLPLPVFPSNHSASSSFDSTSSPQTSGGPQSKRSASPFLRRKKNRTDSLESSSTNLPRNGAGTFSFPHVESSQHHPGSPTTAGAPTNQVVGNASPARPTFKQRSASSTLPQQPQYFKQYSRTHAYNNEPVSSTSTTSSSNTSTPVTPHGSTGVVHAGSATSSGKFARHGHGTSGFAGLGSNPSAMDSTSSLSSLPPNSPYAGAQYAQSQLNQSIGPAPPGVYVNPTQNHQEKPDRPVLPAKKGSFMNLKNAFKAATSGKSSSSSAMAAVASAKTSASGSTGMTSPPSVIAGNQLYTPKQAASGSQISQAVHSSVEGNNYPALRNPFNRSLSSNALPGSTHSSFSAHGSNGVNVGSANGFSSRTVERSGSGSTGLSMGIGPGSSKSGAKSALGGKMYRVKDKVGLAVNQAGSSSSGTRTAGPSAGSGSGSISGSGSGSGSKMMRHRQQASIATASSIGSGSVGSRYNTSSNGVERVKEEAEEGSDARGFGTAMRQGLGSASGLASTGVGKRSSHGYSSSDHHYQMSKSSHGDHAHPQASDRPIDDFVIPEPRTPGEIVLHELLRHFASRSNDKIEFLLEQPLFSVQATDLRSISEGRDIAYDDLLRSVGAIAKDFPRQVADFVIAWGQNQDRAGIHALSGPREGRMREVLVLLNEKRILATRYTVYRTLLEIARQNDVFERELAAELEESVFEVYALDDSSHPMLHDDRSLVWEMTFALLGSLGSMNSSQVVERFLTRLANLLQDPDTIEEPSARTSLQHLLKGLIALPDSIVLADPSTLGTLGMLFAHSSALGIREAFAQGLEALLRRLETFSKSALEPFEQAIATISSQADRLGAEPGLWSTAFALSVTALRLVSDDEFDRTWQFRLDQAAGMLKSPQHQPFHMQALAGIFRIIQGFAQRQTIKSGSGEALHSVLRHIIPDSGKSEMEGLLSLITAALAVLESQRGVTSSTTVQLASQSASHSISHHDDTTMRIRTAGISKPLAENPELTRTFASGGLPHDDTLGDLVGTLHQLNQFFTEDEGEDYERQMTTPVRQHNVQMGKRDQSRGASMSSNEWNNSKNDSLASPIESTRGGSIGSHHPTRSREFEISSDSDGLPNDEDHTLSPQASAWRYTGVASRHRIQASTSSAGSGQRGKGVFDLEEDISPDYTPLRETPRQAISTLMTGQQRKPGQLRTLMLGSGSSQIASAP